MHHLTPPKRPTWQYQACSTRDRARAALRLVRRAHSALATLLLLVQATLAILRCTVTAQCWARWQRLSKHAAGRLPLALPVKLRLRGATSAMLHLAFPMVDTQPSALRQNAIAVASSDLGLDLASDEARLRRACL
jgi:hypothetical protein